MGARGRRALAFPLAGALFFRLLAPSPARAVVEGSPHDLIAQGYDVVKVSPTQERCNRCHLTSSQAIQGFLPDVPPVLASLYGAASLSCFSCHDGTTIVSAEVDASRTAFHPTSHNGRPAGFEGVAAEEIGLPFLAGDRMECVTCHDPHDNVNRPFLRADIGKICLVCHSPKSGFGLGQGNSTGNHPQGGNPAEISRAEVPLQVLPPFKTPFPSGYPLSGGRASAAAHWDLGGHLSGGAEGTIACVTCHAVHGDEGQPPGAGLLAVDPVNDVADLLCEGCHAGQRGDALRTPALPNPGGTAAGRTYHPCDDDAANGEGRIVEVGIPAAWPLGGGEPRRLLCSTCHGAHGAQPATALLRPPSEGATFCGSCHLGMPLEYHHSVASGGACDQFLPAPREGEPPGLSCGACHRAHNAGLGTRDERRFVPLLREEWAQPACLRCHPEGNPTCDGTPAASASHFLGDPLEAYGDATPPLRRDPWPESGLFSGYGGAGGLVYGVPDASVSLGSGANEVTCLSCHAFRRGAVVSGDALDAPHLLARSGTSVEWAAGEESRYLCTGCHSVAPGTTTTKGQSHPMMNANVEKLSDPVVPPATITPKGHVNCDSCHRPHRAVTAGGYYMLETVGGANTDPLTVHPKIDFTSLCQLCHAKY